MVSMEGRDFIFGSSMTLDRSTTHPKFDPTGVRTHDLQIMTVYFMSLRRLLLTTLPSVTSKKRNVLRYYLLGSEVISNARALR